MTTRSADADRAAEDAEAMVAFLLAGFGATGHHRHEAPDRSQAPGRDLPLGAARDDLDTLAALATAAGLRARPVWLTIEEAAASATPAAPLVARRADPGGNSVWLAVVGRRLGRALVAEARTGKERRVDAPTLAALIGVPPGHAERWLMVEPFPLVPASGGEHGTTTAALLARLAALVRPDRADLWSVVVFALVIGALTLAVPIAVQTLVNTVAFGGLIQPVVVLALLLLGGLGFAALLTGLQAYVAECIQRRLFVRVATDLAHRLPRVRADAFDERHGPELVNRFFDVVTVQKQGATLLLDGIAVALQTTVGLVVLSFYHPAMLAFSVLLLTGIAVVVFGLGRGAVATAVEESKAKYAVAGWLEELARHPGTFRGGAGLDYAVERADGFARDYVAARRRHYRVVLRQLVGALGLQVVASAVVLGLGGGLVIAGQLTLGQLVASELIVTAIVAAFAKLGKHLEGFYDLLAAVDKLGMLFDLPLERRGGEHHDPPERGGAVEVRDVTLELGAREVARGLTLSIAAGERVALAGRVGSGKSTLLELLYGLRQPADGYVLVDGHDLRDVDLDGLRARVAWVRSWDIFEGTILENVQVGRRDVSAAQVRHALEAVGLLHDVSAMPGGLRTRLAATGLPLSHGQRSRLVLARAIAGRPRLLLLDDPVAGAAAELGPSCLDGLFDPHAPWTLVVATNRPELIARCDRTVRLGLDTGTAGETAAGEPALRRPA
jgi:ABC-type bacteriocin/lantibiotic exporter with double-glycine peptidase domain